MRRAGFELRSDSLMNLVFIAPRDNRVYETVAPAIGKVFLCEPKVFQPVDVMLIVK
jgi:hypothetical protein